MSSPLAMLDEVDARTPTGRRRLVVLGCVAVAATVGVVGVAFRIGELGDRATANAARDVAEREFGGGNSLGVDKEALYAARALIPPDERYRLVLGDVIPGGTELSELGLPDFTRHFLLPRRRSEDASWVLCYGCDPAGLVGWQVVWDGGNGVSIGRVAS